MITPSPKERAEWRRRAEMFAGLPHRDALRLLDALDVASARAEQAEKERDFLAEACATLPGIVAELDAAKARAEKAEKSCLIHVRLLAEHQIQADSEASELLSLCDAYQDGNLEMAQRLVLVEAERDCLAEALAWGAGRDKKPLFQHLPWMDAKAKWLAYARAWRRP